MPFLDRADAAAQLVHALAPYRGQHALLLALPRGGVPMGAIIAYGLEADLDVVLVRKIGAPGNPEFAVGAVDETGWTYLMPHAAAAGAHSEYIARERAAQLALLHRRRALYTPGRQPLRATGRLAIVVDDGIATGASMIAALHAVRAQHPLKLVCAVPVAPSQSIGRMRAFADEVICLETPPNFTSVGSYYRNFAQVSDDEVIACLGDNDGAAASREDAPD